MHHVLAPVVLVGLIAFAFGERTAQRVVAVGLLAAGAFFLYIIYRVVTGTI